MKTRRTTPPLDIFLRKQEGSPLHKETGPVAVGTGFIALDIVLTDREGSEVQAWAGGTCGNVLAILAFLGWQTYPMATLGDDLAGEIVINDLARFGVISQFLGKSAKRHTPIVVEEIRTKGVTPRHRFVWTCPNCGAWLPGYRTLLATEARALAMTMPSPNVFFFDRVSRGALDLAQASAKQGAIVVFEPSGIHDERLFLEAVNSCHILKYSHERLNCLRLGSYSPPFLEIETFGSEGLRYRARSANQRSRSRWREMRAYSVDDLRDAVGAGDWCTAGLLQVLGTQGVSRLLKSTRDEIEVGLSLGQALAAVKCGYEGARGLMYSLQREQLQAALVAIQDGSSLIKTQRAVTEGPCGGFSQVLCPKCSGHSELSSKMHLH